MSRAHQHINLTAVRHLPAKREKYITYVPLGLCALLVGRLTDWFNALRS